VGFAGALDPGKIGIKMDTELRSSKFLHRSLEQLFDAVAQQAG
jgi:hypothetical protein